MHMQNWVEIHNFVLKILSGNEIWHQLRAITQGGHPHAETNFPDFSLTFPRPKYCGFTTYLSSRSRWQIPFTSSLKCTTLILQMKQIKSLNSFLAQNVLKLTSFNSFERAKPAREKINTFFKFQAVKIPTTTHTLGQIYEIAWLFPDFLGI